MEDVMTYRMAPMSDGIVAEKPGYWMVADYGVQRLPRRPRALQRRRPKGDTRRLQVMVEAEFADALVAQAEAEHISVSGLVARLLRDHVRQHPLRAR